MHDDRVYSPSQTETFLFCPVKRELQYQEHIVPRVITRREMSALYGKAYARGIAHFNLGRQHLPATPELAAAAAQSAVMAGERYVQRFLASGHEFRNDAVSMYESMEGRLHNAVQKTVNSGVIPAEWAIRGVEMTLPDGGNARPDLIVQEPGLPPFAVDYKLKITLDSRYRDAEEAKYRRSWQMFHYAHFVGKLLNTPVEEYAIVLTVLEPWSIKLLRYTVNPNALAQWLVFARETWKRMAAIDAGEAFATGQTNCRDQFGPCVFQGWCWEGFGDEILLSRDYVRGEPYDATPVRE